MPRLSIVIPALASTEALERTLVSVLERRPADCEIIVVLNASYDDPYQLTDEVRFVSAPLGASWTECVASGLASARAAIVSLVAAGAEVGNDWSGAALAHFADPLVWAVAPATYCSCDRAKLLGSGIDETTEGIVAPPWWAGFYRKAMLEGNLGGFDPTLGDRTAAADLAWRQALAGRRSIAEPREVVYIPGEWIAAAYGLQAGYETERVFWRRRAGRDHRPSLLGHLLLLIFLAAGGLVQPRRWLHLAGKLGACPSIARFRREGKLAVEAALAAAESDRPAKRVKPPHMLKAKPSATRRGRGSPTSG